MPMHILADKGEQKICPLRYLTLTRRRSAAAIAREPVITKSLSLVYPIYKM